MRLPALLLGLAVAGLGAGVGGGCRDHELEQLAAGRDAVCACKDAACIEAALKRLPSRATPATPRAQALAREMLTCMAAIYKPEAGEPVEPAELPESTAPPASATPPATPPAPATPTVPATTAAPSAAGATR
jgi:hypothetical protein